MQQPTQSVNSHVGNPVPAAMVLSTDNHAPDNTAPVSSAAVPSANVASTDDRAPDTYQNSNASSSSVSVNQSVPNSMGASSATAAAGGNASFVAPMPAQMGVAQMSMNPIVYSAPEFDKYNNSCLECLTVCCSICFGREDVRTRRTYYPHPTTHAHAGWREGRPSCAEQMSFCCDKSYCHNIVCSSYKFECATGSSDTNLSCADKLLCCGLFKNANCCDGCGSASCSGGCNANCSDSKGCDSDACKGCGEMLCCCCAILKECK